MRRSACLSTHEVATAVGEDVLRAGGNALKAALKGYFAVAGSDRGVPLAPMAILVGGTGAGVRVFDGRSRQPGLGGKRPRGFTGSQKIRPAAHVAVPWAATAVAVACGYHTDVGLAGVVRAGVDAAKRAKASRRQVYLEAVASFGAAALAEGSLGRDWLAEFGPVEGGTCTREDLRPSTGADLPAVANEGVLQVPWGAGSAGEQRSVDHGIVAVDPNGLFVSLGFQRLLDGQEFAGGELLVPMGASPVLRGVTRVSPGSPIDAAMGLRLYRDDDGRIVTAEFETGRESGEPVVVRVNRDPVSKDAHIAS